jgi:hypothetical protein
MCCFFTALVFLGPRFAGILWWLFQPARWNLAFDTFIIPILGIIFLPWTTLMYLIVWSPITGIYGLDWLWLGLGVVADIAMHSGGAWGNKDKIPGYGSEPQTIEKSVAPVEPAPPAEEPTPSTDDSTPQA